MGSGTFSVVAEAQRRVAEVLEVGDIAVDATAGNGRDTAFLAATVGPGGRVFSVDIQAQAIASTRALLDGQRLLRRVTLVEDDHANLAEIVPERRVKAIMYNLGFLPLSDKQVVTRAETTLPSLETATTILAKDGLLTVIAYRGHEEGQRESEAVQDWMESRDPERFRVEKIVPPESTLPPVLWVVAKTAS